MKRLLLIILVSLITIPFSSQAQCKSYAKRVCKPFMTPYQYTGQVNSAVLRPGDVAEVMLTFYSDQEYRLLVCLQEQLDNAGYKLYDTDKALIHESKEGEDVQPFDFKVSSTQQLILEVTVPLTAKAVNGLVVEGCVTVMVGTKTK